MARAGFEPATARLNRREGSAGSAVIIKKMLCEMTGLPHRLFWMRSARWCQDCRQNIESRCEGGGRPSVAEVLPTAGTSTTPNA